MAKYYGAIGYAITEETSPGVWTPRIVERNYYGDVSYIGRKMTGNDKMNDDIEIDNQISILADPYAMEHFHFMKYIVWYKNKWKIASVEVAFPRLILKLGGLYNEE